MTAGLAGQTTRGDEPTATDLTLRRMIGLLGTLLPFVLLFGGYLSPHSVLMRTSISAYYYTMLAICLWPSCWRPELS